jgi:hypothetical protein
MKKNETNIWVYADLQQAFLLIFVQIYLKILFKNYRFWH